MAYALLLLFQGTGSIGFDPIDMWRQMGWTARDIVIILFIMSVLSIAVMVDRYLLYSAAKKQSRTFAPKVAGALKQGRLDEAIKVAEVNKKSHLAKVVAAGLGEFQAHQGTSEVSGDEIDASQRALARAQAIEHAELKRGLGTLATVGATAPFVGLLGTVVGIIHAFASMSSEKTTGLTAVAGGISEALVTTALGLFVAIPAVWAYNYFSGKIEAFDIEMDNSGSELVDYFLKQSGRSAARK
ncbi:MAG TPA: MotA/TolQ/ExbB proton channel family protein [Terriglobales bacterium]|jgi:biopolymer transport protein ExbB/biopolymer transport protein TolQ